MTRYEQMAGTPEKFAKFVAEKMCSLAIDCVGCPFRYSTESMCMYEMEKLINWLNEPAEAPNEGA